MNDERTTNEANAVGNNPVGEPLTDPAPMAPATGSVRCGHMIEVEWPGHRSVLSRHFCRRKTRHPSGKCHHHRPR